MATAADVDFLVDEKITQMDDISTSALEGATEFLDGMLGSMPRTPIYQFISEMDLDILGEPLEVDEPTAPNISNLVDNTALPATEAIVIPDSPADEDTAIPLEIVLEDIPIPDDVNVKIIELDPSLTFPVDTMVDSDVSPFEYTEAEYQDELLDTVKAQIIGHIEEPAPAISPEVYYAMIQENKNREDENMLLRIKRIKEEWSTGLFTLPNGAFQAAIDDAYKERDILIAQFTHTTLIKQFELTQANNHFNLTAGINLNGQLIQHADNVANRALEAAKSVVNLGIALFNVQLQRYQSALEAYKTGVQVYVEQLRAEGLKVQNYTAQMQGAKVRADVQGQRITNRNSQIAAIGQIYDNYKTEVSAAGVKANIEAEKLRAFKIKIEAEVDKVRSLVAIYEADTSRYRVNISKGTAEADLRLKQQDLISRNHEGNLKIAVESARMNLDALAKNSQMIINASLGGARNYSLLASAAMDSINSVVQLGSTASVSATE